MTMRDGFGLDGRVVLVTGASSGLGQRIARLVADAGAKVILGARRADRLHDLRNSLNVDGERAIAIELDVRSEPSTISAYDAAERAFGCVDTVIANAGVNFEGLAVDLAAEDFDSIVATNLRGVFLTVREGGRRMMARPETAGKDGRVVIISSVTANATGPGLAAYSATKAGVLQMGRVLAREWCRSGINVNILCPGYFETELTRDWFKTASGQRLITKFPRRRLMSEESMDGIVLFLASDASAAVTGSVFTIDDGQTL